MAIEFTAEEEPITARHHPALGKIESSTELVGQQPTTVQGANNRTPDGNLLGVEWDETLEIPVIQFSDYNNRIQLWMEQKLRVL
jgi:hypothetical protein